MASRLARRVDQRGRDGFSGGFSAPQNELEDGVEALAFLHRGLGDGLGLFEGQPVALADQRGVAEDDEARSDRSGNQ